MNAVIDAGNTRTKVGIFEGAVMQQKEVFQSPEAVISFVNALKPANLLMSTVVEKGFEIFNRAIVSGRKLQLTHQLSTPILNKYETPHTLGMDRMAAACGAWSIFPQQASLVIDCGTCINYEFVNKQGEYRGGAISPGVSMRFAAMNQLTDRLPMASPDAVAPLTGRSTLQCLQSGVMNGMLEEINGISARYGRDYPDIRVILTGGDAHFFEKLMNPSIFVAPDLVLIGLNSILLHHVNP
jgi:type III pantothenate kinase